MAELVRICVERSIARGVERAVYRERINRLVRALSDVLMVANYREVTAPGILRDPDEEPILTAALTSHAGFIVSLNTRDFPADDRALGVRYVTPQTFLAILDAQYPDAGLILRAADTGRELP